MNNDAMFVPTVAFRILGFLTIVLPIRWAVVFYLLLVQIDLSALGNFSTDSMGLENAIKIVIIPTLFLFKIRNDFRFEGAVRKIVTLWLLFVSYAAVAVIWSPYRVPAIKMIGYLYAYSALFVVFTVAWQRRWLNVKTLTLVVWISLIGAIIQTYSLDNAFGSDEFQWRFTTFSGAQSFAAFLLCLLVLLVFRESLTISTTVTALGASIGLLLTGSRSIFLGFLWVLVMFGVFSFARSGKTIHLGTILKRTILVGCAMAAVVLAVVRLLPENRLNEMVEAAVAKNATVEDVGTFGWRFALYQKTYEALTHRGLAKLLVGSGTSSGAGLVLDEGIFQDDNVDPNRALHDEFLRAVYEWGFLGLFALLFVLAGILKLGLHMVARSSSPPAWALVAIFVPLLISLTVENFLADSGSPGGVGYNLVLTSMVAAYGLIPEEIQATGEAITTTLVTDLSTSAGIQSENCESQ